MRQLLNDGSDGAFAKAESQKRTLVEELQAARQENEYLRSQVAAAIELAPSAPALLLTLHTLAKHIILLRASTAGPALASAACRARRRTAARRRPS